MRMEDFIEPPTETSLADARRVLVATQASVAAVKAELDAAEAALARVVRESRARIEELETRRGALAQTVTHIKAYLSPIRRLPLELLRNIFIECFDEHPCCAWVLAAVCGPWRRLVLRMPKIWSRIRLLTTQHASADTIRLWLERSGDTVPLDIEIFLRVASTASRPHSPTHRRRSPSPSRSPSPPPWHLPVASTHYDVVPNTPIAAPYPPFSPSPIVVPHSLSGFAHPWLHADRPPTTARQSRSSFHWGHIAIFYLAEQIHRWERFIFRFDRQFASMSALKSITGDAPLLKEFEVSSAEAAYYPEWQWLPNAPASAALVLPRLKTLTIQYTPFKWSSPIFRTNLHTLNLRALPTCHLPLDRILYIITNNPSLHSLSLHFQGALPAVLPLAPTTLHHIDTLHLGGHYTLAQLIDALALPRLSSLTLDIEPREPLEDTILNLLTRSASPALTHFALGYTAPSTSASAAAAAASAFYYGPAGAVVSWPALLAELQGLESLRVGGTPLEPLLGALADEPQVCPALEVLALRNCHALGEGVVKLVAMVQARNPPQQQAPQQGGVKRLRSLEMYECASVGEDVVRWLRSRVGEVVCTEPEFDRRRSSVLRANMS